MVMVFLYHAVWCFPVLYDNMKFNTFIMQNYTLLQCNAICGIHLNLHKNERQLQFFFLIIWNIPGFHKHLQLCYIYF